MTYDKTAERIFKDLVLNPKNGYALNVEYGMNFIKFIDKETGKSYQISIKEIKK